MLLGVEGRVESGRQVLLMLGSGLGALCPRPLRSLALSPASPTQCLLLTEGYLRNVLCSLDKALRYASWWGRPPLLALSSDLGGSFTVGTWLCLSLLWNPRGEVTAHVPNQVRSLILNKWTYQCGHTEKISFFCFPLLIWLLRLAYEG